MSIIENYAQNKRWAQETSNKLAFSTTEYQDGIAYKGNIVSNQLNGISYILSQILQFSQCSGGYYNPLQEYHKGNIVSILHQANGDRQVMKQYICINTSADGIKNEPPIIGATETNQNGITIYTGGSEDKTNWKRCDIGGYDTIDEQVVTSFTQSNANFKYCCELCRLPDIALGYGNSSSDPLIKEVKSDLLITTTLGAKNCTVELKLRGKYLREFPNYTKPLDYWNMPVPDVDFGDIVFHDFSIIPVLPSSYTPPYGASYTNALTTKTITADALINGTITPYGFNVVVGYSTDSNGGRYWGLFLCFAECDKITMNGTSNIDVSLLNAVPQSNITIMNVIPTRPRGGLSGYGDLMELREYDTPANTQQMLMLHHSKGEIELRSAMTISNKGVGVYWLLSRLQGVASPSLKEHTARHTRAYGGTYAGSSAGSYLEPGLPNYYKYFQVTVNGTGHGSGSSGNHIRHSGITINLSTASSIYQTSFEDVRAKSISVARYLKCF